MSVPRKAACIGGGVIGAGWVASKATTPLRILATLGLTPLIAALVKRRKKAEPTDDVAD